MRRILVLVFIIAFILLRLEACENRANAESSPDGIRFGSQRSITGSIDRRSPSHFHALKKNVDLSPEKVYLEGWHLLKC